MSYAEACDSNNNTTYQTVIMLTEAQAKAMDLLFAIVLLKTDPIMMFETTLRANHCFIFSFVQSLSRANNPINWLYEVWRALR